MLKIVKLVSNIMRLKEKRPKLMPFYSINPEISIEMCALSTTLNPATSAIFRIFDETTEPKSIEYHMNFRYL